MKVPPPSGVSVNQSKNRIFPSSVDEHVEVCGRVRLLFWARFVLGSFIREGFLTSVGSFLRSMIA